MSAAVKCAFVISLLGSSALVSLAQAQAGTPLISILDPIRHQTYLDALVPATVHFRADADAASFRAQINGKDITESFEQTSSCKSGLCDVRAYVPASLMLHGANVLSVEVNGPNETSADDDVRFIYEAPEVQATPVSKLTPAVAITSVRIKEGGSDTDYRSYEIVVGPGPLFPETVYSASDLSCPNGINSVQVLVLKRQSLAPETQNSRGCFGTPGELGTFLKAVPKNDLVILNNFLGRMSNIYTTAIGGTNYNGVPLDTSYYNAIGVAGAPPGTAYESYQSNLSHTPRRGRDFLPALTGSLVLDIDQNYYFAPKDYLEVKAAPGTDGSCATITVESWSTRHCVWPDSQGGMWIVAIDRRLGVVTDSYDFLETNSNDPQERKRRISEVAWLLDYYYKSNDLVVITTLGTAFRSGAEVTQTLCNSIVRLGGNGFVLPLLSTPETGYSLVSSPDPTYVAANKARESLTQRQGENGRLDLVLSRDRVNQLGLYQDFPFQTAPAFSNKTWPATLFAQPTDWPAWSSGEAKAYEDLTASDRYPTLKAILACRSCTPLRDHYADNIPSCAPPPYLAFNLGGLSYVQNSEYTDADFRRVVTQLAEEQGFEGRIYSLCGQIRELTNNQSTTLKSQLKTVGDTINSSLLQGARKARVQVANLATYANYASFGSAIPYVGAGFSAVSASLHAAALVVPSEDGIPGQFAYTLDQLNSDTDTSFGPRMSLLVTNLFTSIANDWGKLQTIGLAIGERRSPWYFCSNCQDATPPLNSLPLIALGAKRLYYTSLLPTSYSVDLLAQQSRSDPRIINRWVDSSVGKFCQKPYGDAPNQSFWSYQSINAPSAYDIYVVTQTAKVTNPLSGTVSLRFPSTSLLSDVLDLPVINPKAFTLTGGAGILYDDFIKLGSRLPLRGGFLPGEQSRYCPYQ